MELYYRAKFRLSYSIKTFLTKRTKTHYQCGKIEAPYFKEGELCARQQHELKKKTMIIIMRTS